jgi:hypothetical protein
MGKKPRIMPAILIKKPTINRLETQIARWILADRDGGELPDGIADYWWAFKSLFFPVPGRRLRCTVLLLTGLCCDQVFYTE